MDSAFPFCNGIVLLFLFLDPLRLSFSLSHFLLSFFLFFLFLCILSSQKGNGAFVIFQHFWSSSAQTKCWWKFSLVQWWVHMMSFTVRFNRGIKTSGSAPPLLHRLGRNSELSTLHEVQSYASLHIIYSAQDFSGVFLFVLHLACLSPQSEPSRSGVLLQNYVAAFFTFFSVLAVHVFALACFLLVQTTGGP